MQLQGPYLRTIRLVAELRQILQRPCCRVYDDAAHKPVESFLLRRITPGIACATGYDVTACRPANSI
jgi:hypothetical protein